MQLNKEKHESHDFTLVKVCMCNVYYIHYILYILYILYLYFYIYLSISVLRETEVQKKNAHKVLTVNFWKVFFFSCDIYLFFLFILFENS